MRIGPRATSTILIAIALPALAATPPSQMMANVYRLTEAGASLDVCMQSPAFKELPAPTSEKLTALAARLAAVVDAIGRRYGDTGLNQTYAATRAKMAAEPKLRFHMKANYAYCGERFVASLEAYVAENEKLIGDYLRRPPSPPRRPAPR